MGETRKLALTLKRWSPLDPECVGTRERAEGGKACDLCDQRHLSGA